MKTVIEMMRGGIEEDGIRRAGEILKKRRTGSFPYRDSIRTRVQMHWMRQRQGESTVRKADLQTIR